MSIPKIIHYCWFGGNQLPEETIQYMESWKKFCPDFKIKEWNENNFDIHCCKFVEEAYTAKKWAFVSDYVRFYAMYKEGGVYIETDCEVVKPIDELLEYGAFFGRAGDDMTLSMCGTEKGHPVAAAFLKRYNSKRFINQDGQFDMTAINKELYNILCEQFGLEDRDEFQVLDGNTAIYPEEYFFSYDYETGLFHKSPKLYVIHYGEGSWLDEITKRQLKCQHEAVKKFGARFGVPMGKLKFYFDTQGVVGTVKIVVGAIARRIFRKG